MRRARLAILMVLASTLLAGCAIPLAWGPGFMGTSRDNIRDDGPMFIVVSRTTREDVLLALGEPDGEAPDGSWFSYGSAWTEGGVGLILIVPVGGPYAGDLAVLGGKTENVVFRRLLVHFDAEGTVRDSRFQTQACRQSVMGGGVIFTAVGGRKKTPPCIDIAATELRREQQLAAIVSPGDNPPPTHEASWFPERRREWTMDRSRFTPGTVLVTETSLVFLPAPGAYGPLPKPVRIAFAEMAKVTSDWLNPPTITRVIRRDGRRDSFLLPAGVRDLVAQRARVPAK